MRTLATVGLTGLLAVGAMLASPAVGEAHGRKGIAVSVDYGGAYYSGGHYNGGYYSGYSRGYYCEPAPRVYYAPRYEVVAPVYVYPARPIVVEPARYYHDDYYYAPRYRSTVDLYYRR